MIRKDFGLHLHFNKKVYTTANPQQLNINTFKIIYSIKNKHYIKEDHLLFFILEIQVDMLIFYCQLNKSSLEKC